MTKNITNHSVLQYCTNTLGEGLHICASGIYWLDIIETTLFLKIKDGRLLEFNLPEQASVIWKVEGRLVYLASESGICTFDLETNNFTVFTAMPETDSSSLMRANDGTGIDNERYFFGTMEKHPSGSNGALYVATQENISKVYEGIGIPNSFIRVNESSFLVSDSLQCLTYRFTFNSQFSAIEKKELWLDLSNSGCTPDGGCVDDKGNIYIAIWGGACVNKYDKDANLISTYQLPALQPTNCKLSIDGKSLFITSARQELSESELEKYPSSGSLYQIGLL
jgi:sugar lactone lactonase YvrE